MSTKIYHGYRAQTDGTFRSVLDLVSAIREAVKVVHRELVLTAAAELLTTARDATALGDELRPIELNGKEYELGTLFEVALFLSAVPERPAPQTRHHLDFTCDITVHQAHDAGCEWVYLMGFFEAEDYHAAILSVPGIEDFYYQDSSDGPEEIPPDEWRRRGDIWAEVLGPSGVPAKTGLTAQLLLDIDPMMEIMTPGTWPELVARAPSPERRAKEVALRRAGAVVNPESGLGGSGVVGWLRSVNTKAEELASSIAPTLPVVTETYLRGEEG